MSDSAMEDTFENLFRTTKGEAIEAKSASNPDYVNRLDRAGHTPLMGACAAGRTDLVKILLKHGADVHFTAQDGKSPWDCAMWCAVERGMEKNIEASELMGVLDKAGAGPDYAPVHEDTLRGTSIGTGVACQSAEEDFC